MKKPEWVDFAQVRVHGVGVHGFRAPRTDLDLGNSGTAMRLMMGLLAPQGFDSTLIGDESLMRRPMERVAAPLRMMGARIDTHEGQPPVEIHGTQIPDHPEVEPLEGSEEEDRLAPVSGLLLRALRYR